MPFGEFYDGRQYKSWEQDPSTRESLRLFTKRKPIDITLTTPGTAEDIITVDTDSKATVNLITNPSCETGTTPTGYSAVRSATLAKDGTYYYDTIFGSSYSLKVTPPNTTLGEGAYWDLGRVPGDIPLALSFYSRRGASGAPTTRAELVCVSATSRRTETGTITITNARLAVGSTITNSATWQRNTLVSPAGRELVVFHITAASGAFTEDETVTGGTSSASAIVRTSQTTTVPQYVVCDTLSGTFSTEDGTPATETIEGGTSGSTATLQQVERIKLIDNQLYFYMVTAAQTSVAFYVDAVQAEIQEQCTTYCDGAQGWLHWWDGTANASTSRRWREMSSIRGMRLHATRDCYIAYDNTASNSSSINAEDRGELIKAGTDFWENHPIYLDANISFINRLSGEQPQIYGVIDGV